jgi:hypothetical protein
MTTHSITSRRLAAGSLVAAAVAVLAVANPAAATSHPADDAASSFDPASLPRTADAIQSWYDQCRAPEDRPTTGPRQDYTSWLTNPMTAPWADRAGHR